MTARARRSAPRHDVGRPARRWGRVIAIAAVPLVLAVATVLAGAARFGPLRDLGWVERGFLPSAVTVDGPANEARLIEVAVPWNHQVFCYDRYSVAVSETGTTVEVGQVRSRVPRFAFLADLIIQGCTGELRVSNGQAFAPVHLSSALGARQLVRAADGHLLAPSSG
jgi:hypothetical protein